MSERVEMPMQDERCDTCRYYVADNGGECRKRSPQWTGTYRDEFGAGIGYSPTYVTTKPVMFPPMPPEGWCGEWKAKT